jgi:membrane protease YdiL (CAAX protease family)
MSNDIEPKTPDTSSPTTRTHIPDSNLRSNKWLAFSELLLAALLFTASAYHHLPLGRGPWLLALGWVSLYVRKIGWRGVGLTKYGSWAATLGIGLGCGVLLELFELFVSQPILVRLLGKKADLSQFHDLTGNLKQTALYILFAWIVAAFGEEMIYRGYLMNRVADLLNRTRTAWIVSLIGVHIVFGLAHSYQGLTGVIDEGLMGALLAVIYLRTGRNLAVPIVAHGVQDTIDLLLIFCGKYPGM